LAVEDFYIIFVAEKTYWQKESRTFSRQQEITTLQINHETRRPIAHTSNKRRGHWRFQHFRVGRGEPPVVCCYPKVLCASFCETNEKKTIYEPIYEQKGEPPPAGQRAGRLLKLPTQVGNTEKHFGTFPT